MNADRLLALFERISEAPDAIPRLRRFILELAVRGKLVEQDPEDEPAGELLREMESRFKRLRITKKQIPLEAKEIPFSLPDRWQWTRLGQICEKTGSGSTPRGGKEAYGETGIPFLRSQNVYNDGLRLADVVFIDKQTHQRMAGTRVLPCDLLLNITGGSIGRCAKVPVDFQEANVSQHVAIIRVGMPGMEDFIHALILSPYFQSFVDTSQTGAGRGGLPKNRMDAIPVALPPLAEQHRIVAKVDELMALCDQLEAARQQREQCRERLVAASLQRLNQPNDDPEAFRSDARFALQVLPSLTSTPAQIKQLRQTILSLAVRGKLVEQDPQDEPAIITVTGALLAAADSPRKKGRRKASWTPPTENENQELPAGWHLFSLAELVDPASPLSYGVLVPGDNVTDGVPFVRAQDLMLKDHPALPGKKIAQEIESKYARTRLMGEEILICVVGSIGKIGVVPKHWSGANIARAVARLKLIPEVPAAYMLLVLQSGMIQGFFKDSTRTLAQPTLNISLIEATPIPLPPLAEQHRIVAKVDELMVFCDQLEQQLSHAEQSRRGLLEALLQEALADSCPSLAPA
jgi:type I restriction enzyme S subunit